MNKKPYDKKIVGADQNAFRRNIRWAVDQDYVAKLKAMAASKDPNVAREGRASLEWLAKFNNEYYHNAVKKGDTTALHHTDELRQDCHRRQNAMNRDVFGIYNSGGAIEFGRDEDRLRDEVAAPEGLSAELLDEGSFISYLDAKRAAGSEIKPEK